MEVVNFLNPSSISQEVFETLNLNAYDLSTDSLDVHAVSNSQQDHLQASPSIYVIVNTSN